MSVWVIGLYLAFAIPIYLRWKAATALLPGLAGHVRGTALPTAPTYPAVCASP